MAHGQSISSMDTAYTNNDVQLQSSISPLTMRPLISSVEARPFAEQGIGINRSVTAEARSKPANESLRWPRIRSLLREPFAEFLGTFILVMFGDGAVAQVLLSHGEKGNYTSIAWGYGLGVMLGAYTAGISGAHLNPAVTLTNCVLRGFPWRKLPIYALAQLLGGLCAAAVIYGNYLSAINVFEGGADVRTVPAASTHATAGISATYPAPMMTTAGDFFSEFIATSILMFMIYCLQDNNNYGAGRLVPLGLFATIFGIATCFGWETSFAINPARDLGPRIFTSMVGYGSVVYTTNNYYFWVPLVAPTVGAVFGGFLYDILLFTGQSPINTPYWGLYRLVPGWKLKNDGAMFTSMDWKDLEKSPV